jgi:hypothetical protein
MTLGNIRAKNKKEQDAVAINGVRLNKYDTYKGEN